jgi:hypothetical protein
MHRTFVILVLLGTAGLLAACGGSGHTAATAMAEQTPARTSADNAAAAKAAGGTFAGANRTFTKRQAIAFAHAVNLRLADVPGFRIVTEHEHDTAAEKRLERAMLRCVGFGALASSRGVVEASSPSFERETNALDDGVHSEVSVVRTVQQAATELAAARSDRAAVCVSHYLDLLLKSQKYHGARVSPVAISQRTPPAPGTAGSFGWHITTTLTLNKATVALSFDIVGFVYGPAEVSLFTSGAPRPFPASTEEGLFSLLLARAKAHGA